MISDEIKRIDEDIVHLQNARSFIQNNCPHVHLQGKYFADTGNWDRASDSYWINLSCPDCKKCWTEDQADLKYNVRTGKVTKEGFKYQTIK